MSRVVAATMIGMKPPRYDRDELRPLLTQTDIEQRVRELIGRAARRQLWFLFVDEGGAQLPILIPVEDHPSRPDRDDPERFSLLLDHIGEQAGASGVVMVVERFRDATLTRSDRAWAGALHEAVTLSALASRGILVSHAKGVRWVAPDDYLLSAPI